jgi:hypothetical protein
MNFSRQTAERFSDEREPIAESFVPLNELVARFPQRIRLEEGEAIDGVKVTNLFLKHPYEEQWTKVALPHTTIAHKGGAPRVVLDIVAGSDLGMQAAELPLHDFDVVIAGDHGRNFKLALAIGADHDGVEHAINLDDFADYCSGRDTNHNQTILDYRGLRYSADAFRAAQTGILEVKSVYVPGKAIYGVDRMKMEGVEMNKPRGLNRLMKFVVEGKAKGFYYEPVNANMDVGIYALFLSKRWMENDKFPDYMQKLNFLLDQMGQTVLSEHTIIDVLERAHKKYPFFDFYDSISSMEKLFQWKTRKLAKQNDRETTWAAGLPTDFVLKRRPHDRTPHLVSLKGYRFDSDQAEKLKASWPKFLQECQARTTALKTSEMSMYRRLFFSDPQVEDLLP